MENRNPILHTTSKDSDARGYYSRVELQKSAANDAGAESEQKRPGSGLMSLCKEIAGTLIRRYSETSDSRTACDEVRSVLIDKLDCDTERAMAMIDLALELIRLNSYGEYRRNDLEMSLLVSRAAGQFRETDLN